MLGVLTAAALVVWSLCDSDIVGTAAIKRVLASTTLYINK